MILRTSLWWISIFESFQLKATDRGAGEKMLMYFPVFSQLGPIEKEDTSGDAGPSCELKPEKPKHLKLNLLWTLAKVTLATTSLTLFQSISVQLHSNVVRPLYSAYMSLCTGLSCFVFFKIMRLDASHCTRTNPFLSSCAPTPCLYVHLNNDALCWAIHLKSVRTPSNMSSSAVGGRSCWQQINENVTDLDFHLPVPHMLHWAY